jgi:hypothetical protein
VDGAFFGTSLPQIFLLTYPDLNPKINPLKQYIPKIYGFKIFGKRGSKYYDVVKKAKAQLSKSGTEDKDSSIKVDNIIRQIQQLNLN